MFFPAPFGIGLRESLYGVFPIPQLIPLSSLTPSSAIFISKSILVRGFMFYFFFMMPMELNNTLLLSQSQVIYILSYLRDHRKKIDGKRIFSNKFFPHEATEGPGEFVLYPDVQDEPKSGNFWSRLFYRRSIWLEMDMTIRYNREKVRYGHTVNYASTSWLGNPQANQPDPTGLKETMAFLAQGDGSGKPVM